MNPMRTELTRKTKIVKKNNNYNIFDKYKGS